MPKKTTLIDRLRNAINTFRGIPIGSIRYGIEVHRCSECNYAGSRFILEHVHQELVDFRHDGKEIDFDDLIKCIDVILEN